MICAMPMTARSTRSGSATAALRRSRKIGSTGQKTENILKDADTVYTTGEYRTMDGEDFDLFDFAAANAAIQEECSADEEIPAAAEESSAEVDAASVPEAAAEIAVPSKKLLRETRVRNTFSACARESACPLRPGFAQIFKEERTAESTLSGFLPPVAALSK